MATQSERVSALTSLLISIRNLNPSTKELKDAADSLEKQLAIAITAQTKELTK